MVGDYVGAMDSSTSGAYTLAYWIEDAATSQLQLAAAALLSPGED